MMYVACLILCAFGGPIHCHGDDVLSIGYIAPEYVVGVVVGAIVCVGASNVINFMDGINGITAGYSLSVLLPLMLVNEKSGFVDPSLIYVSRHLVFWCFVVFNFFSTIYLVLFQEILTLLGVLSCWIAA